MTQANTDYIGSITIDRVLMQAVDLWEGEKVMVTSLTTGERLETYIIAGEKNSGEICINGSAAKKIKKGEIVIIMGFAISTEKISSKQILVDKNNKIIEKL